MRSARTLPGEVCEKTRRDGGSVFPAPLKTGDPNGLSKKSSRVFARDRKGPAGDAFAVEQFAQQRAHWRRPPDRPRWPRRPVA